MVEDYITWNDSGQWYVRNSLGHIKSRMFNSYAELAFEVYNVSDQE